MVTRFTFWDQYVDVLFRDRSSILFYLTLSDLFNYKVGLRGEDNAVAILDFKILIPT